MYSKIALDLSDYNLNLYSMVDMEIHSCKMVMVGCSGVVVSELVVLLYSWWHNY